MVELSGLVETLSGLTVLEAAELIKQLEAKWSVSSMAPAPGVIIWDPISGIMDPAPMEFILTLVAAGEKKLHVIKAIRAITGLGLTEAKNFVEGAPKLVKDGLSEDEAEKLRKLLVNQGAIVEVKQQL